MNTSRDQGVIVHRTAGRGTWRSSFTLRRQPDGRLTAECVLSDAADSPNAADSTWTAAIGPVDTLTSIASAVEQEAAEAGRRFPEAWGLFDEAVITAWPTAERHVLESNRGRRVARARPVRPRHLRVRGTGT